MTTMDCKTCRNLLPDLLFEPGFRPDPESAAHLAACPACRAELDEIRSTMALMDAWTAPEPSAYFDARVHAHLRAEQDALPEGLWERLATALGLGAGRGVRPVLAAAFVFLILLGGGTAAFWTEHHGAAQPASSPTVNDLRIYDNNAQAIEQMDMLDDSNTDQGNVQPQS